MAEFHFQIEVLQIADLDEDVVPEDASCDLVFQLEQRAARYRFDLGRRCKDSPHRAFKLTSKPFTVRSPQRSDSMSVKLYAQSEEGGPTEEVAATPESVVVGGESKDVGVRWLSLSKAGGAGKEICRVQVMWDVSSDNVISADGAIKDRVSNTESAKLGVEEEEPPAPSAAVASISTDSPTREGPISLAKASSVTVHDLAPTLETPEPGTEVFETARSEQFPGKTAVRVTLSEERPEASPPHSLNRDHNEESNMTHLQVTRQFREGELSTSGPSPPMPSEEDPVVVDDHQGKSACMKKEEESNIIFLAKPSTNEEESTTQGEQKDAEGTEEVDLEGFNAIEEDFANLAQTGDGDSGVESSANVKPPPHPHNIPAQRLNLYATSTQRTAPASRVYENLHTVPAPTLLQRGDTRATEVLQELNRIGMLRERGCTATGTHTAPSLQWMHHSALGSLLEDQRVKEEAKKPRDVVSADSASQSLRTASTTVYEENRSALQRIKEEAFLRAERKAVRCTWRK